MEKSWSEALILMRTALAILDASEAPSEVGADLDLAIARLESRLGEPSADAFAPPNDDDVLFEAMIERERELIH